MTTLLIIFLVIAIGIGYVAIIGIIDQYDIPLSQWTIDMYVLQLAMVIVYSAIFAILAAIPVSIYFFSKKLI